MKRIKLGALVAGVAVLGFVGTAQAQKSFDEVARGAEWVPGKKALAPLFWAFATKCGSYKDDLAKRQCTLISNSRKKTITGKSYLVEAERTAFQMSEWDPKTKKVNIGVRPCLACDKALKVGGQSIYVLGEKGKTKTGKAGLEVATMYTSSRTFKSAAAAKKWKAQLSKRVRTQFVVQFPNKLASWKAGGKSGLKVNIVGFRVYDPCDGRIVCASPNAKRERPDRRACSGRPIVENTRPGTSNKPKVKKIPYRLSPRQIARALRPAIKRARKCKDTYGMTGTAQFTITISAAGRIIGLKESGDFVDTPTGDCVAKEVKSVKFPQSKKARTTITYPVILQ